MSVKLYVEGGGHKALNRECRAGFGKFIENAGVASGAFSVVACGSRRNAYDSFRTAHGGGVNAMLLVDAEAPVTATGPWQHLKARDGWVRPKGATNDQCHLMVQVMESWFLADVDALDSFYGRGFRKQALPGSTNVEAVSKLDVSKALQNASRSTGKGGYHKGAHSFAILETLNPAKVRSASPHADRLIGVLSA